MGFPPGDGFSGWKNRRGGRTPAGHRLSSRRRRCCGRQYDAVIYDPDSFPPDERAANLTTVLACPVNRPVAVHSYDIGGSTAPLASPGRHRGATP
jgi:hypothetical protein